MENVYSFIQRSFQKFLSISLIVFSLSFLNSSFAATITSVAGSGAWNAASSWTGGVIPGANDDVVIATGATVTVPASVSCRLLTVNGELKLTGNAITLTITNNSTSNPGLTLGTGGNLIIGSSNTLEFATTQGTGITNNGGTIASTGTNGEDGGTILINSCCGGSFTVAGLSGITVYNLKFKANATFNITAPSLRVNGAFTIPDNNWQFNGASNSPVYGPASTLYINKNNQSYTQGKEWTANAGTIGITPGYPNNVTLVNMGTSAYNNTGWHPTGNLGLNGTLHIGDGTLTGRVTLEDVTSFTCGGLIVDNNSLVKGPKSGGTFINKGDLSLTGATAGIFQDMGAAIDFAGSGSAASPQKISGSSALQLGSIIVSNGTYVQLQSPVSLSGTLDLSAGVIGTSTSNTLTVTNTATTAITGGNSSNYIDGPLTWSLSPEASEPYIFPVGNAGTYLPLTFALNYNAGSAVTVTAFKGNAGGSSDGSISSISKTEYWSLSTSSPFSTSPLVGVSRPTAVAPYDVIALSATVNGTYKAAGGTVSGSSITEAEVGSATPVFIALAKQTVAGLSDINESASVTVFPNPVAVSGQITIRPGETFSGDCNLRLYNNQGQVVYQSEFLVNGDTQVRLSESIPAGIYQLELRNKSGLRGVQKLIIQ